MLLQIVPSPGFHFATTTGAMGMTDGQALDLRGKQKPDETTKHLWRTVFQASERLLTVEPVGRC